MVKHKERKKTYNRKKKENNLLRLVCRTDGQTDWWMMREKPTICNGFSFQREKTHGRHEKWWQMTQGQEAILTQWRVIAGSQSWNGGMCSAAIAPTGVFKRRSVYVCGEAFSRAASDKLKHESQMKIWIFRNIRSWFSSYCAYFYLFRNCLNLQPHVFHWMVNCRQIGWQALLGCQLAYWIDHVIEALCNFCVVLEATGLW